MDARPRRTETGLKRGTVAYMVNLPPTRDRADVKLIGDAVKVLRLAVDHDPAISLTREIAFPPDAG